MSVPKDLIDRNLKKASDKSSGDLYEVTYEAYGFGGVGIVCEALTDNLNRAVGEFRDAVKKSGGKVAEPGSVLFNFERKGVVRVKPGADEDDLFMVATEAGADDLVASKEEPGATDVLTAPGDFDTVVTAVREAGIEVDSENSGLRLVPNAEIECDTEAAEANEALVDRLLDLDDIDAVYVNMAPDLDDEED
mmetsp:Transcript_11053/g.38378  ORF Transcript_11053/g.38378 Transcript_11053/m.38378 type:complete len:192 (+) Transcript_11053:420-995(+)